MNKTAIKNYAIWARVQLIEAAKQRAYEYEITEDGENKPVADAIGGHLLTQEENEQRRQLIDQIRQKGYTQVMEEAAYTWFNRFIALRFMEVNGYLPSKVRVFTDEAGTFKPEILKQAMSVDMDGLDRNKVLNLLDKQDNEALYKYLLITQCNALNAGLPYMFEKISNWTELLFPANLLRQDSVIGQMITTIPEEDWTDQVQIIGWLYQYYNSELKDETFALLKKNVKITKERIPAATQLFTPDWIVRYMVENSLGRLWYEGHPDFDKSEWKYYLDEAEQEPEVEEQLKKIRTEYARIKPEDIKVIDPCCGSGHILVYAFDVLMQIYTSAGWSERDAAKSILENNLYGLDIDDRAGQLAYFAVMMKARKYSRRILNGDVKPNVLSIQESNWMTDEFIDYVAGKDPTMNADLVMLRKTFKDAKEYGSILNVPAMQYDAIYERIDILTRSYAENIFQTQYNSVAVEQLLPLVKQSQIMSKKYDVVVTNPPYVGNGGMSPKLSTYVKDNYSDSKSDLFAVFIEQCGDMTKQKGFQAMITQHAWMFLSSFEKLRAKLLARDTVNMAHLGARAFEEIGGEVVQTTSFVLRNTRIQGYAGTYCRLIEPTTQQGKEDMFLAGGNRYFTSEENFSKIPGSPIAYWVNSTAIKAFQNKLIGDVATASVGIQTGDNASFLRLWWEIAYSDINRFAQSSLDSYGMIKWFPYNKGGEYRKWIGNEDTVINWRNDGEDIKKSSLLTGHHYQEYASKYKFAPLVTWSRITSGKPSFRFRDHGSLSDMAGFSLFADVNELYTIIGLCNSIVGDYYLRFLAPTMNIMVGQVLAIPYLPNNISHTNIKRNIELSQSDWNSFEASWDFKKHPLV